MVEGTPTSSSSSSSGTLAGRAALVTGGGSGIGRAAALLLAAHGARVAVVGRTRDKLEEVVAEIEAAGGGTAAAAGSSSALALEADTSQPEEIARAVAQAVERFGRLDVVFANAGINGVWAPIEELEPEEWDETLGVNLRGTFLTVKYAIPHLKERGGSVVITSSVNGTRIFSNAGATAYSCSKAGQVAFAKMAALELAKHKIRVNVICPGAIESNIEESTSKRDTDEAREPVEYPAGKIPLTRGRAGAAEQVARLVLFLAGDGASHITGTEVWIDGAESLLQG